jgi:hypothetical protein
VTADDDPFAAPVYGAVECPDCGGRDGHYIHCPTLAEKHGICPKCWLELVRNARDLLADATSNSMIPDRRKEWDESRYRFLGEVRTYDGQKFD